MAESTSSYCLRLLRCALAAAVTSCSATGLPPSQSLAAAIPGPRASWMAANAKDGDLVYVSDYETNDIYAFSYPQGKLRGVLAGVLEDFVLPTALCTDAAGDLFVPDSGNASVLVYAHGSTKPMRTLADPGELPYSCAIDPTSGDLAVVDYESGSGAGGVAIYRRARGLPKTYHYGFLFKWYFAGYDAAGDLFADAVYDLPSQGVALVELPKGSHTFETISLTQTISEPGAVVWDGKNLVVGDGASTIYRFVIAGSVGNEVGSTQLARARAVAQFFIDSSHLAGANFHGARVCFWRYPAGGTPEKTLTGFGEPFGIALSRAH
jgi:DNA-binding beta-propeller fold protein YncE